MKELLINTYRNDYLKERIKLSLGDLYDALKEEKAFLAGGAITSLVCNREINDWDIYFRSKYSCARLLLDASVYKDFLDINSLRIVAKTQKSVLCTGSGGSNVQLITCKYYNDVIDIFKSFDFTVCMGAYDFDKECFFLEENFLLHNSQRYLKFNPDTLYPMISALRVKKYSDKGYYISKMEMMRILAKITTLKIESWEDAEDQLGGMYGETIKGIVDDSIEFSMEALMDALGKETARPDIQSTIEACEWYEENILDLFDIPEQEETEKLYYKTVGSDGYSSHVPSHLKVDKILYEKGTIINGGDKGIFCVENPTQVYRGDRFVILRPILNTKYNNQALIGHVYVEDVLDYESDAVKKMTNKNLIDYMYELEQKENE